MGSTRFGANNRFANFGAGVGAAWILSEENFLKGSASFISFAKLQVRLWNYRERSRFRIMDISALWSSTPNYQGVSTVRLATIIKS